MAKSAAAKPSPSFAKGAPSKKSGPSMPMMKGSMSKSGSKASSKKC